MADQSAPQGMETKNMPSDFHSDPNVVRPAPVPYGDSTHIDRGENHQPEAASGDGGDEKKTATTRKSSPAKS